MKAACRVVKKKFLNRQANRRIDVLVDIMLNEVAPYYAYLQEKTVS